MRRLLAVACMAVAALVAVSIARADFNASASAGPQSFSSATLSAPSGLALACSHGTATFTWTATPSSWADGYEVLASAASGGPYAHYASVSGRSTTTFVTSGTGKSFYVVRANKGNWTSSSTSAVQSLAGQC